MIVLVLVLVWVAALLPIALKKRSEWELSSSIGRFRQRRQALVRYAPAVSAELAGASPEEPARRDPRAERAARARLRAMQERRRRTLGVLAGTLAGSLVLGAIPALHPLWDLSIVAALCTVGYLGALVYLRRLQDLAVERERKVVELAARARHSAIVPIPRRPPFVIVEATS